MEIPKEIARKAGIALFCMVIGHYAGGCVKSRIDSYNDKKQAHQRYEEVYRQVERILEVPYAR